MSVKPGHSQTKIIRVVTSHVRLNPESDICVRDSANHCGTTRHKRRVTSRSDQ